MTQEDFVSPYRTNKSDAGLGDSAEDPYMEVAKELFPDRPGTRRVPPCAAHDIDAQIKATEGQIYAHKCRIQALQDQLYYQILEKWGLVPGKTLVRSGKNATCTSVFSSLRGTVSADGKPQINAIRNDQNGRSTGKPIWYNRDWEIVK